MLELHYLQYTYNTLHARSSSTLQVGGLPIYHYYHVIVLLYPFLLAIGA